MLFHFEAILAAEEEDDCLAKFVIRGRVRLSSGKGRPSCVLSIIHAQLSLRCTRAIQGGLL